MNDELWARIDRFIGTAVLGADPQLEAALAANTRAGLRAIDVSEAQGRFLELLVRMSGARRVLEIGTLGGYSAIAMSRGLPDDGRLITLELEPRHAEVARANFVAAGVADRIECLLGPAVETLARLVADGARPFDLIFIDADKPSYPAYLEAALKLSRPGTTLVFDNVVREGRVLEPGGDANAAGARMTLERLGAESRLRTTVLQTVGSKGHDGFALAVVI